jgi:hypothetical protein
MDRASTAAAFSVVVNGRKVAGSVDWAEDDTVLVFDPKQAFPHGATVVLRVSTAARAAGGAPLDRARAARFRVASKPKPAPKPAATSHSGSGSSTPKPQPKPPSTPVARPPSGSWVAAEKYLLTLLNCTRGGGWVLADGSCSSPGGSGIAPLTYHAGVSNKVSRPYAKKLATAAPIRATGSALPGTPGTSGPRTSAVATSTTRATPR